MDVATKEKLDLDPRVIESWRKCRTLGDLGRDGERPSFSEWLRHLAEAGGGNKKQ